jgi:hypothetical protein
MVERSSVSGSTGFPALRASLAELRGIGGGGAKEKEQVEREKGD